MSRPAARSLVARDGADLLEPNQGAEVVQDHWLWSLGPQSLVWGISEVVALTDGPIVKMKPKRLFTNVPRPHLVTILEIVADNQLVLKGPVDAYHYAFVDGHKPLPSIYKCAECGAARYANLVSCKYCGAMYAEPQDRAEMGQPITCPLITPSMKVTVRGTYSGMSPAPYTVGYPFDLVISFLGLRVMRAGGL